MPVVSKYSVEAENSFVLSEDFCLGLPSVGKILTKETGRSRLKRVAQVPPLLGGARLDLRADILLLNSLHSIVAKLLEKVQFTLQLGEADLFGFYRDVRGLEV